MRPYFFCNVRVKCVKRGQSLCVKLDTKGLSPFDTLYPLANKYLKS